MKKIIAALIAALFAAVTLSAVAADEAKPADAKPAKSKKHNKKAKKETAAPAAEAAKPAPATKKRLHGTRDLGSLPVPLGWRIASRPRVARTLGAPAFCFNEDKEKTGKLLPITGSSNPGS